MSKIYSNLDSEEDLVIELGYFNNHLEVNRLDTLIKIGNILVVMFTSKANGRYVKLNCQVIDTALSTNVYNSKKGLVKKENDALHFNVMSDIYDYKKLEPHFDSIRSNLTKLTFDNIFKSTCDLLKKSGADKAIKDYLEMQFSSLKCFDRNYIDLCFKSSEEYISEEPEQNTESVDYNTNKFEYDDYE